MKNRSTQMWLILDSPNTNLFGPQFVKDNGENPSQQRRSHSQTRGGTGTNPLSSLLVQTVPLGRYGAPKPKSSMGQVITNIILLTYIKNYACQKKNG